MQLHPQAQDLVDSIAESGAPPLHLMSVADARLVPGEISKQIGPGPAMASVRDISIPTPDGSIGARVYEPAAEMPGTIVYYHGGGWVVGTLDDWDAVCRALAAASGCRLVSVDYRLAPEHRYPAAADDSYAALVWVADNLAGGRPIAVAGDSAGGNLAAVVSLRARDEGGPAVALQLLVYPVVDHDLDTGSHLAYS